MTKKDIFIIAILLRLIIMPFFAHPDLFSTYQKAAQFASGSRTFFSLPEPITHLIEAVNLRIFSFFLGSEFFYPVQESIQSNIDQLPHLFSLFFILKLPYLLAEIAAWWLIFKYLIKPTKKNILLIVFNPIILYSLYCFGRYESFALLFSLLILKELKEKEIRVLPLIVFSLLLIFSRVGLIIILPAFLFLKTSWAKKISLSLIPLACFFIFALNRPNILNWVKQGNHPSYILGAKLDLGFSVFIYLFFVVLGLFLLKAFKRFCLEKETNFYSNTFIFSFVSLGILFSYYSTSIFHPQYLVWFIPFYLIIMEKLKEEKILLMGFCLIHLLFFPLLLFWGQAATLGLFPLASKITQGIPTEQLASSVSKVANIAKSILSAVFIFSLLEMIRGLEKKKFNEAQADLQ